MPGDGGEDLHWFHVAPKSGAIINHRFLEPLGGKKKVKCISPPFKGLGAVFLDKGNRNA